MSAIEWTAIGVVVTVMLAFFAAVCAILRRHDLGILGLNACVVTLSTRLTHVETAQANCKKNVEERLKRGEETFDRLDTQIEAIQITSSALKAVTEQLHKTLETVDARMWHASNKSNGATG